MTGPDIAGDRTDAAMAGYPPLPPDADWEALRRYSSIRLLAECFRLDAEAIGLPPDPPAELWARAQRAHENAERAQTGEEDD